MTEGLQNDVLDTSVENPPADWKGTLPKEVLTHIDRFKTTDELAKGYAELNTTLGSRVKIPDDKSTPEEINKFFDKLRPAAPDKYELKRPEKMPETMAYDEKLEQTFRQLAHVNGLTNKQAQVLYDAYNQHQTEVFNGLTEQIKADIETRTKALKDEWKGDYDKNTTIEERAYKEILTDEFRKFLTDSNMRSDPIIRRQLYNLGTKMLDDTLVRGTPTKESEYKPAYPSSPEMYRNDNSEEGVKARKYFTEVKGFKY